jgi:chromosome partitioning protein
MIISIINNKGGTGKTTSSVSLSYSLAEKGYSVLLLDLDPQSYASFSMGIKYQHLKPSIHDCMSNVMILNDVIRKTENKNLFLVTSEPELASWEIYSKLENNYEETIKSILSGVYNDYDFILLDCPPSFSLLSLNAAIASDYLIIPLTPEYLTLEGFITFYDMIRKIAEYWHLDTELLGILFTMVDSVKFMQKSRSYQNKIMKLIKEKFKESVFESIIFRNPEFTIASSFGENIFNYAPNSKGASDYRKLTTEILKILNIQKTKNNSKEEIYDKQVK